MGEVASWLARLSPDRAVRIRAQAEEIALCSWARHLTLRLPPAPTKIKYFNKHLKDYVGGVQNHSKFMKT